MSSTYTCKHTSSMGWDWYHSHRFSIWRQTGDRQTRMNWMQETVSSESSGETLKRTNHSKACHLNHFSSPAYISCHGHKNTLVALLWKWSYLYVMLLWELWNTSKVRELATVCLPWQHWTKALVWFDDDISAFHSCVVVDLWQSRSEWHI